MKKFIIIFSFILLVMLININEVQAVGKISLSTNSSNVNVGDEFSISVNLSGASVVTLTTRISVDTSKVEYVSGPSNSNFSNGKVIYTWTDSTGGSSPISSGTIATFKFKAKSAGTANFGVTGDFFDVNEKSVNPSFSGTSVTIKGVVNDENTGGSTGGNIEGSTGGNTGSNAGSSNSGNSGNTSSGGNASSGGGSTGSSSSGENTGQNNTVTVSSNADLKSLQLDVQGINPKFNKKTTQYYITVSNLINNINITAIPENSKSKVSISGNTNLKIGLNKISILVTAQDGKNKKTYNINVTKTDDPNKSNANLENLAIENCVLVPEFNSEVVEYNTELYEDITSVKILAVSQNESAKVEIVGNENLQIGENKIQITVTAQDGITVKSYAVIINKIKQEEVLNVDNIDEKGENMQEQVEQTSKNKSILYLLIVGVLAIIIGICYKNRKKIRFSHNRHK